MTLRTFRSPAAVSAVLFFLFAGFAPQLARAQYSDSSSSSDSASRPEYAQEKAPSLIDPAGPTISLVSAEPVFFMAAALNACGYDEGLNESEPIRKKIRDEMNQVLVRSETARDKRDKVCLFIAQHRMTGTDKDISQYISLALYLSQPPNLDITVEQSEMPPDSTQVIGIVPLLKDFAQAMDLHGIWLTLRLSYDHEIDELHDPLSQMIVSTNLYLKMPASTYSGRRFIVVIEPQLSPHLVNARVYGSDYVVVVSPSAGPVPTIPMNNVRHIYLHYLIEPLLYARTNAIDRMAPILKELSDAPMDYRYRSDPVPLTVECLIKAIEARTMDTKVPVYKIPADVDRSQLPRYEHLLDQYHQKVEAVRWAAVQHDMRQGFVLTQYYYEQLVQFEKTPVSLSDTIGEMVYSMDIDQQVHRARDIDFDKVADEDVLQRSMPRKLTGLDLAEARLAEGDAATAQKLAQKALNEPSSNPQAAADAARAHFILARVAIMTGHPQQAMDDFKETVATSKEPRILAWSHIYLGRMADLECNRNDALTEYKAALAARDGQLDTRLAAERGIKTAYSVNGHTCSDDEDEGTAAPAPAPPAQAAPAVAAPSAPATGSSNGNSAVPNAPQPN